MTSETHRVMQCLRVPVLWLLLVLPPAAVAFDDADGCLVCHQYPLMGRIAEQGERRSYYVLPSAYANSVHRNVSCRDCHREITRLPHEKVVTGVTCDSECHTVENPATGENFSHAAIARVYEGSVHGRAKIAAAGDADKPYCTTCHTNPIHDPVDTTSSRTTSNRCMACHEDPAFVDNWYQHTSHRFQARRQPREIVELCRSCHADPAFVKQRLALAAKTGRDLGRKFAVAVDSWDHSLHGKVSRYGLQAAANCLDCHAGAANDDQSAHDILASHDSKAPTHPDNRTGTCQRCHTNAGSNYASIDPHPTGSLQDSPVRFYADKAHGLIGDSALFGLIGLAVLETIGRRRDGVGWRLHGGSSWHRRSRRSRPRVAPEVRNPDDR